MAEDKNLVTPRPTPKQSGIPLKVDGFATVVEALEYAATGVTGLNFFDLRGDVSAVLPYSLLAKEARALGCKLMSRFPRGERIGIVAETSPGFIRTFYACQYAGLIPAPMPLPVNLGGKDGYLLQIKQMIEGARATAAIGPENLTGFLEEAVSAHPAVTVMSFEDVEALPSSDRELIPLREDENCYIQYSSGSTSAPKGVIGTQRSVMSNLHGITEHGLKLRADDRAVSWLPLYHDMGLIGFVLSPMTAQRSVDFIATSDFVRRPLLWLRLASEMKATATYSPSFGYDLSARRAARAEEGSIDLSNLRIAGIGGDMVRPEALKLFTDAFSKFGFDAKAFLPSYGMAEATLAISFTDLENPIDVDYVDMRHFNRSGVAQPVSAVTQDEHRRGFVRCGKPLPDHDIIVRGENGETLADREVGRVFIKGPSITPGYYSDEAASKAMFDGEWMDTGDMGYSLDGQIVITGRAKDLIIINGRNIWPQDIEWAVETVDGVREGGVAAFSIDDGSGERIVVVAERRGMDDDALAELHREVARTVQQAAGAPAQIVLARPHSMVMTSSGKLSRAKVKQKYLNGAFDDVATPPAPAKALAEAHV